MGASTGIFGRSEVAVMVAVVLLTTLLTPIALRGTFNLKSQQDIEEGLAKPTVHIESGNENIFVTTQTDAASVDPHPDKPNFRVAIPPGTLY